jgi:hypothetical protein
MPEDPTANDYLSEEELDALEYQLLVEWLESVPTSEWHIFVHQWNFDNADDILHWLSDNPRTERATALMLYWMKGARFFKQYATAAEARAVAAYVEKNWLFIHQLEERYVGGFYATGTMGFDPTSDPFPGMLGYDWTADYRDQPAAREIPAPMLGAVPGLAPLSSWDVETEEGIPLPIVARLEALRDPEDEDED